MVDALQLACALIAAPSVTPASGKVFDVLEAALTPLGFTVERAWDGAPPHGPVENLLALRGQNGPLFAFAGHLDVVPPGEGWHDNAFEPRIANGLLYGRGATDMKGAIAAFVAAAARQPRERRLMLIITGDEEGVALHGTRALIERMEAMGVAPDLCVVGEPTSARRLGDTVKIGRRGSLNALISVEGAQGHVAYPQLARNPIPSLLRILAALTARKFDDATDWFERSNLEVTSIDVGNPATNVIPAKATARVSIRFNDQQRGDDLEAWLEQVTASEEGATIETRVSGEAFLTLPGQVSRMVSEAVAEVTGIVPALSTTGGTSDARFLSKLCPVVEFGPPNATMHKVDEAIALADLASLEKVYEAILDRVFSGAPVPA